MAARPPGSLAVGLPGCQEACQEGWQGARRPVGRLAKLSGGFSEGLPGCQEASQECCQAARRPVRKSGGPAGAPAGLSGGLSVRLPRCQEACHEVKRPARRRNRPDPRDIQRFCSPTTVCKSPGRSRILDPVRGQNCLAAKPLD